MQGQIPASEVDGGSAFEIPTDAAETAVGNFKNMTVGTMPERDLICQKPVERKQDAGKYRIDLQFPFSGRL